MKFILIKILIKTYITFIINVLAVLLKKMDIKLSYNQPIYQLSVING